MKVQESAPGKSRSRLVTQLMRLLGLVLFAYILSRTDLPSIGRILSDADPVLLLLSIPLFVPNFLLKAARWGVILLEQGFRTPLLDRFLYNLSGFYVGAITPGRVGEFVRVFYLRDHGVPSATALFSVFFERIFDILVIGAISLLAIPIIFPGIGLGWVVAVAVGALVLATTALWQISRPFWATRLERWLPRLAPGRFRERIRRWVSDFLGAIAGLTWQTTAVAVTLTLLATAVMYGRFYMMVRALRIDITFLEMSATAAVAQLISLIPITVSGIGTRDAVFLYAFERFGLSPELAIAFSFMVLFAYFLNTLFGLGAWLIRPINYRAVMPGSAPPTPISDKEVSS